MGGPFICIITPDSHGVWTSPHGESMGGFPTAEAAMDALQNSQRYNPAPRSPDYQSPHWEQPNVLGHIRMNDRTGPNGEKILHVEELQSDWHQKGKKEGYQETRVPTKATRYSGYWEVHDDKGDFITNIQDWEHPEVKTEEQALQLALRKIARLDNEPRKRVRRSKTVPDAPFKKTWPELMLKRVIKYAADHGYDGISWTPGTEQADRYDLSKQVSRIVVMPKEDGTRAVRIHPIDGDSIKLMVDKDGTVRTAFTSAAQFDGKHLSDVVGGAISAKVRCLHLLRKLISTWPRSRRLAAKA